MAPRRYGKTSLLKNLIYKLRKSKKQSNFCVYLDIFDCASTDDFANRLVESIVNAPGYDSFKKKSNWVNENLLSLRTGIKFSANTQGDLSIEPQFFKDELSAITKIQEAFKDLENIGKKQNVLLVIDEFQTILSWDKKNKLEHSLRSITQSLKNVNIAFSGSQVRLLHEVFDSPDRPFYNQVYKFSLGKIDPKQFKAWVQKSFSQAKIKIDTEVIDKIFDMSFGNPRQIQFICRELFEFSIYDKQKNINLDFLEQKLKLILERKTNDFENIWLHLTNAQKKFLRALAQEGSSKEPYSKYFCKKYNLLPNTIQAVIPNLELKYIITIHDGWHYVTDPIFNLWLR